MTSSIRLLPLLTLVACGGGGSTDVDATLVFADRSDAEIARMINAASITDVFQAQSSVHQFDYEFFEFDPCPAIAVDGDPRHNRVTITGGCTTATSDMIQVEGSATITNPVFWENIDYVFTEASTYEFAGFAISRSGFRTSFDGRFTRAGRSESIDADLTTNFMGILVRSDIYAESSQGQSGQSFTWQIDNSGLELVGVGGALLSGDVVAGGGMASSNLTLRGADTLRVEQSGGCVEWRVEGTDRMSPTTCP